jgi:V/A-type H+-transporting ATPase subunit A
LEETGRVVKVSGPLVIAENMATARIYDVVSVSEQNLIGEIIEMRGQTASIQVYEETSMLGPGEKVITRGEPLSVELGPGLIESMFDGIQRPLEKIRGIAGDFITRGVHVDSLDREKKWDFKPVVEVGDELAAGDIIGTVQENVVVEHRVMVPVGKKGKVKEIKAGGFNITETVCVLETDNGEESLTMMQKWPVRIRGR